MFDKRPYRPFSGRDPILHAPRNLPVLAASLIPEVTIRPANAEEQCASRVWQAVAAPGCLIPEVAEFADGGLTHAPEVIEALRALLRAPGEPPVLIYLHRGAQAQCVNPLLPSLLYLAGHRGPAHALRCTARDTGVMAVPREVLRFARAMTPVGSHALIIDDQQLRLAPAGRITPAAVNIHHLRKPGRAPLHLPRKQPAGELT